MTWIIDITVSLALAAACLMASWLWIDTHPALFLPLFVAALIGSRATRRSSS